VPGVVPPQVQDYAVPLAELHEAPVSPLLQPYKSPDYNSRNCDSCNVPNAVEQLSAYLILSLLQLLMDLKELRMVIENVTNEITVQKCLA